MSDLRELYQEVILDHNRNPRNFKKLEPSDRRAEGHNPLCGDRLTLYVNLEGERIKEIGFVGNGCAISKASASLMTEAVKGKTLEEVETLFEQFHDMVTAPMDVQKDYSTLGKLAVFSGVREFPIRVKCASLCWHTLHSAIQNQLEITTE